MSNKKTGKYIECIICKKIKYFRLNIIKKNKKFYCSKKCYYIAR